MCSCALSLSADCPPYTGAHSILNMAEIQILSVNCQGLGSSEKRTDVFNYIKSKHCHIYCLQDVHSTQDNEKCIRTQWGSHCLFSSGKSNSRGVAILFSKNLDFKLHGHISDKEGNFLLVDLSVENNRFTLNQPLDLKATALPLHQRAIRLILNTIVCYVRYN